MNHTFANRLGESSPSPRGRGQGVRAGLHSMLELSRRRLNLSAMPNTSLARALRKKRSWAEKLVWQWLRDRRFSGYKFRREHPAGKYLLDFFCEEARLPIELDGFEHGHPARQTYDGERTRFLETLGIKELRFWNSRLRRESQAIRETIFNALQERAPHPLPEYTRPGIIGSVKSQGKARPHPSPLPRERESAGTRVEHFKVFFATSTGFLEEASSPQPSPPEEEREKTAL